mmetsp:Transcript_36535/g.58922  ORF Transcript_36535/g.58922 Transcript_36535/m.58922 type:complete len:726 (-) Transcript_36535:832-3009(-)|eukprot:CAMPEP_0203746624 /NCGR_PEP_ID=MMETSP0098-20131031/2009_1 /ASSEMBLY_ACC=CAM_ASM_000208 /TAXON_ID=96639 /ORGANISM=" , Strain NY0313808BC1" /LENGTH=725 /DNA_ID=CAMNT_0050634789 /DNA_START=1724 /DNA_END=3904 /DNA_ORIENTATION=+
MDMESGSTLKQIIPDEYVKSGSKFGVEQDNEGDIPVSDEYDPKCGGEDMPVVTLRMVVITTLLNFILGFCNQVGTYRTIQFSIPPIFLNIISYPIFLACAKYIPSKKFSVFGMTIDTNPGPFNVREHLMVGVVTTDAAGSAYVANTLYFMEELLGQNIGFFGDFLLIFVTKVIGLGFAGFFFKYLIMQKSIPWPGSIYTVETFRMLHEDWNSKFKYFLYFFVLFFMYQWLPSLFWAGLGSVSILCWFGGSNLVVSQLASGSNGFGIGSISLDPSTTFGFFQNFFYIPMYLGINAVVGGVLWAWVLSPAFYYADVANAKTFPVMSTSLFQANGSVYPTEKLFNDQQEWQQDVFDFYGVPYQSMWYALGYFFSFVSLTAGVSHVACYHYQDIKDAMFKGASADNQGISKHALRIGDAHTAHLRWSGLILGVAVSGIFIGMNYAYDITMPWWAVLVSVAMALFFILPIGVIQGITGTQLGLNILCELFGGLMLPHNPNGAILVKVTGYMAMSHALNLVGNMKAGQYLGINYRDVYYMQVWGTFIACLSDASAYRLVMNADLINNVDGWKSSALAVYETAAYMWGGIGPWTFWMGPDSHYYIFFWAGLGLGAILPVIFYMLSKKFVFFKYVHIPMMCVMTSFPYTNAWYMSTLLGLYVFQYLCPRYWPNFYKNFIYVSIAGISGAIGLVAFAWAMIGGFGHAPSITDVLAMNTTLVPWMNPDAGCLQDF